MISVVIPMYNSEDTIISALESVKKQSAVDLISQIIVVNDGSTDNSLKVLREYAQSHKELPIELIDQPNGGVSRARNSGIRAAKAEFIALLDSDDEWLPDKIKIQVNLLKEHPEIDFLGGNSDKNYLKLLFKKIDSLYKANIKDLCIKNFPETSTAIFKREKVIDLVGFYDEIQRYAEDGNYNLRICSKCNYYHLPIPLIRYGGGKPGFGFSGLSANLLGMYQGNVKNIRELKQNHLINTEFYLFLRIFYWAKYIRRVIITKTRKK